MPGVHPLRQEVQVVETLFPKGHTPVKIKNGVYPRDYYPNTELLGSDEMRLTALGTGMPNVITGAQKASAWSIQKLPSEIFSSKVFPYAMSSQGVPSQAQPHIPGRSWRKR